MASANIAPTTLTISAAAAYLGCGRDWLYARAERWPELYGPGRGPLGPRYLVEQLDLIRRVIAGLDSEEDMAAEWALRRQTIGRTPATEPVRRRRLET